MSPKDKSINPQDLPVKGVFQRKEVFQHPQPADSGKALDQKIADLTHKPADSTARGEGLNEENSEGHNGAFEGVDNQE